MTISKATITIELANICRQLEPKIPLSKIDNIDKCLTFLIMVKQFSCTQLGRLISSCSESYLRMQVRRLGLPHLPTGGNRYKNPITEQITQEEWETSRVADLAIKYNTTIGYLYSLAHKRGWTRKGLVG